MNLLEFHLDTGERITIDANQIYWISEMSEIKGTKNIKAVPARSGLSLSSDMNGFTLKETYDEILNKITTAQAILDAAEADDDAGESN